MTRLAARRQTRAQLVAVAGAGGLPGQDDGLHHPEADGALRAAAPASLQPDHQAGAAPHHQGGLQSYPQGDLCSQAGQPAPSEEADHPEVVHQEEA